MKIESLSARFHFNAIPFTCELRPEEAFSSDIFDEPRRHLLDTIDKRMSAALVAPAGAGKTFVLRSLVARLPEARYRITYIKVTQLPKRDFCREIARAIGVAPAGTYPTLFRAIQDQLHNTYDIERRRPVLVIDEAHDMKPEVLSVLRLLTNFEMDSKLVVSVILAGQAGLARMLSDAALEDVAQRLAHYASIRLLSRQETGDYIKHRCRIAGGDCPFDPGALEAIYEIGKGNLRATNQLALKTLGVAHLAQCDVIDSNHVIQARSMICPPK